MWTKGINSLVAQDVAFAEFVMSALKRHAIGDWGNVSEQDQRENEYAIGKYLRIFSAYNHGDKKIWIITEANRSTTTVLFPNEY
jgi:hypothetical protein